MHRNDKTAYFLRHMRSGWRRFGAFGVAVAGTIVLVVYTTRDEPQSTELLLTQIGFIAAVAYLVTFLVWPRRVHVSSAHPSRRRVAPAVPPEPAMRDRDPRPVLVIGDRPAGSRPGSRVHVRDTPTLRAARGRRPGPRSQATIRWPIQR